jgi:hypothetical protein
MSTWKAAAGIALLASVQVMVAQSPREHAGSGAKASTLTAQDYIEIQQLLARYSFALDTGADNGYMYADLYAPDGVFNKSKGREELAALARGGRRGPANVRNLASAAMIRPSPDGATGVHYAQAINFGENREPTELDHFGHYEDVYTKTPAGWRFKSRTFVNESGSLRAQPSQARSQTAGGSGQPEGPSQSQSPASPSASALAQGKKQATPLGALDRIEIQQLVAQANYALSTGMDDGRAYAALFTPDGSFGASKGREQLAAFARGGRTGARSLVTNVLIDPSPDGAVGRHYEVAINFVEAGRQPVALGATGRYEDVFAKTHEGWRFKKRTFLTSIPTSQASKAIVRAAPRDPGQPPPPPVPASVPLSPIAQSKGRATTLTPTDYLEIQNLVGSYGQALDSGIGRDDNGEAYAGLFAADGVFGRPYTTGHDALVALAHTQPHDRQYIRHFLTNMIIEPAPEGAVGRQYLVVVDIGEGGKPSSVLIGGHYEDAYVKTPAGWRFKSRTLYPARTGAGG